MIIKQISFVFLCSNVVFSIIKTMTVHQKHQMRLLEFWCQHWRNSSYIILLPIGYDLRAREREYNNMKKKKRTTSLA